MPTTRTDLRLAPAALAVWATASVVVAAPPLVSATIGCSAAAGAGLAGAMAARRPQRESVRAVLGHAVLLLLAVAVVALVGAAQLGVREAGLLHTLAEQQATVRLVGTVSAEAVPVGSPSGWGARDRVRLKLAVERVSGRGRAGSAAAQVLVLAGPEWAHVPYGTRVAATGRLAAAPRGTPEVATLVARGSPVPISPLGAVDAAAARIRTALLVATDDLAPDPRGLVPGIAVGDTTRLPPDLKAAMRTAGLTHVTAVSGAHFAIIGACVLGLTGLVGMPRLARVGVVAAAMVALILLVHPQPSVLRAAVMGAVGVGGLLLRRPSRAIPALGATVIALLIVDPWLARSFGFVLSVLATAGIVLLTVPIASALTGLVPERRAVAGALPGRFATAVAIPIAAQCACAPVVVLLNPALATYAVPANLAVAPALAPATVLGVLAAMVAPWWSAGGAVLGHAAGWAAGWIAAVARVCAALPGAQLPWPAGLGGASLLAGLTIAVGIAAARHAARR